MVFIQSNKIFKTLQDYKRLFKYHFNNYYIYSIIHFLISEQQAKSSLTLSKTILLFTFFKRFLSTFNNFGNMFSNAHGF